VRDRKVSEHGCEPTATGSACCGICAANCNAVGDPNSTTDGDANGGADLGANVSTNGGSDNLAHDRHWL
jgi:hypothetical protein